MDDESVTPNQPVKVRASEKILDLASVDKVLDRHREQGSRIVHCHGVFDLLHVGHLRHMGVAKSYGDVLVVSITADAHVQKGPDRPVFAENLRAEMLAGLGCVDYVVIVDDPSAEPAINAVRPHVYVKGGEYDNPDNDITGKITREQSLVESHGGRVEFTYDLTFSSSRLLNNHFNMIDDAMRAYLAQLRDANAEKLIFDAFERIADLKVLVVGETIIDHYNYVSAIGKAAKENIIATQHIDEEYFAGGVIAAANHLSALCPEVEVVTVLGDPALGENFEEFVREQLVTPVEPIMFYRPGGPTVQKTRFVEPTYIRKLFEIYRMDDRPLPDDVCARFHATLAEKAAKADLVVVNDFGHGFINRKTAKTLTESGTFVAINVQTNAGNQGYNLLTKYPRADYLCIDAMEARLVSQDKHMVLENIVADVLPVSIDCPTIVVTHGKSGCFALGPQRDKVVHIPAFRQEVVDTVGAGDAFFVISAPFAAVGLGCEIIGFMGNVAGAMKVGVVGHREAVQRLPLQRYVSTLLK